MAAVAAEQDSLRGLHDSLKDTLEANGAMGRVQALMRNEVLQAMSLPAAQASSSAAGGPTQMINQLIEEYLAYQGYTATLSVFRPECGCPATKSADRQAMAQKLGLQETPQSTRLPLLYSLAAAKQGSQQTAD